CFVQLLQRLHLDLDLDRNPAAPRPRDGPRHPAGDLEVVVLDQDGVRQRCSMERPAARHHRVALECPKARDGLAGAQDARGLRRLDEGPRRRGDPGQVREEVDGDALGSQDRPRGAIDHGDDVAPPDRLPVDESPRHAHSPHAVLFGRDGEDEIGDASSGENAVGLRPKLGSATVVPPDREVSGQVAGGRVLGQGPFDQIAGLIRHRRHPRSECPTRGWSHSESGRLSVSTRDATRNPSRSYSAAGLPPSSARRKVAASPEDRLASTAADTVADATPRRRYCGIVTTLSTYPTPSRRINPAYPARSPSMVATKNRSPSGTNTSRILATSWSRTWSSSAPGESNSDRLLRYQSQKSLPGSETSSTSTPGREILDVGSKTITTSTRSVVPIRRASLRAGKSALVSQNSTCSRLAPAEASAGRSSRRMSCMVRSF